MSDNAERMKAILGLFGILIVGILSIVAMDKGFNGDITRFAIIGIVALALGVEVLEYYFKRQEG